MHGARGSRGPGRSLASTPGLGAFHRGNPAYPRGVSPRPQFDQVVHEPTRLKICTTLTPVPELEYGRLQSLLALTAPTLSKHLKVLTESGYVALDKRSRDGHLHTWVSLTASGREALCGHVSEIQRMARIVRQSERKLPGIIA